MPYNTKQKEAVISYLKSLGGAHVSAADIAAHFASGGEKVGLTTIYRQLERLIEEGLVKKYVTEGSGACYQYLDGEHCSEHFHLKCDICGKLIHLECDTFSRLSRHIFEEHGFLSDSARTTVYGKCSECLAKEKTNEGN